MEACGASFMEHFVSEGDVVLLRGDVGAGKSVFVRGAIRAGVGDPDLIVPSPTFLLHLSYENRLHHFDLYRLKTIGVHEWEAFGWDKLLFGKQHVCFIEWPECALGAILEAKASLPNSKVFQVGIENTDGDDRIVTCRDIY
eukprot:CAMPEP_0203778718 /NCGR_PEP_ID=MMETSP0099_2-20121227/8188_1 /ASSEMBLY_ACC=CAM_ASM_000209 /TAXON_ID=96639 /ORGANISM=" , Strain NY0313808BC1" /LENGTH=140 /DNA_ID=CAMNT_0050678329 /DNA_START=274 /DNA_END=696 /DNA_ORIENTATION=+